MKLKCKTHFFRSNQRQSFIAAEKQISSRSHEKAVELFDNKKKKEEGIIDTHCEKIQNLAEFV